MDTGADLSELYVRSFSVAEGQTPWATTIAALAPDHPAGCAALATLEVGAGSSTRKEERLRACRVLHPESAVVFSAWLSVATESDLDEAIATLESAPEWLPDTQVDLYASQLGAGPAQDRWVDTLVRLDPEACRTQMAVAYQQGARGAVEEAVALARSGWQRPPEERCTNAFHYTFWRAANHPERTQAERVADLARVATEMAADAPAHQARDILNRAGVWLEDTLKDPRAAVMLFARAYQIEPNVQSASRMGSILVGSESHASEFVHGALLLDAVERFPESSAVHLAAARFLMKRTDRTEEGLALLDRALEVALTDTARMAVVTERAWELGSWGEIDEEWDRMRQAQKRYGERISLTTQMWTNRMRAGLPHEALDVIRRAAEVGSAPRGSYYQARREIGAMLAGDGDELSTPARATLRDVPSHILPDGRLLLLDEGTLTLYGPDGTFERSLGRGSEIIGELDDGGLAVTWRYREADASVATRWRRLSADAFETVAYSPLGSDSVHRSGERHTYLSSVVHLLDRAHRRLATRAPSRNGLRMAVFTRGGSYAVLGANYDREVMIVDAQTWEPVRQIQGPSYVHYMESTADDRWIYIVDNASRLWTIDTTTWRAHSLQLSAAGIPELSPDEQGMLLSGGFSNSAEYVDLRTGEISTLYPSDPSRAPRARWIDNGRYFLSHPDGGYEERDRATHAVLDVNASEPWIGRSVVTFGERYALVSGSHHLELWDRRSAEALMHWRTSAPSRIGVANWPGVDVIAAIDNHRRLVGLDAAGRVWSDLPFDPPPGAVVTSWSVAGDRIAIGGVYGFDGTGFIASGQEGFVDLWHRDGRRLGRRSVPIITNGSARSPWDATVEVALTPEGHLGWFATWRDQFGGTETSSMQLRTITVQADEGVPDLGQDPHVLALNARLTSLGAADGAFVIHTAGAQPARWRPVERAWESQAEPVEEVLVRAGSNCVERFEPGDLWPSAFRCFRAHIRARRAVEEDGTFLIIDRSGGLHVLDAETLATVAEPNVARSERATFPPAEERLVDPLESSTGRWVLDRDAMHDANESARAASQALPYSEQNVSVSALPFLEITESGRIYLQYPPGRGRLLSGTWRRVGVEGSELELEASFDSGGGEPTLVQLTFQRQGPAPRSSRSSPRVVDLRPVRLTITIGREPEAVLVRRER